MHRYISCLYRYIREIFPKHNSMHRYIRGMHRYIPLKNTLLHRFKARLHRYIPLNFQFCFSSKQYVSIHTSLVSIHNTNFSPKMYFSAMTARAKPRIPYTSSIEIHYITDTNHLTHQHHIGVFKHTTHSNFFNQFMESITQNQNLTLSSTTTITETDLFIPTHISPIMFPIR